MVILTLEYCRKYNVTLVPEKTKLLAFSPDDSEFLTMYAKIASPVNINGVYIPFSEEAGHVGILRSVHGNKPHLLDRLASHRKAMFCLLPVGTAKSHRGNPAATIRAERLFGIPVLLSGLAPLVLSSSDVSLLVGPFKRHMERVLKLHDLTPECVIWFLAGCLPLEGHLHLRQMSLFGMLSRLRSGGNPLAAHARYIFSRDKIPPKSWFKQISNTFEKYALPHPSEILTNPPPAETFKRVVKTAVLDYWNKKLRGQAGLLRSLKFFKPEFMSLTRTHPIFTSCENNPYEVKKAVVQARYLSGRGRIEALTKHWDTTNKEGHCLLCRMNDYQVEGSLEHFLVPGGCPSLAAARLSMLSMFNAYLVPRPYLFGILKSCFQPQTPDLLMQFLLDCTAIPQVITMTQELKTLPIRNELLYLTRTYVFKMHCERRRLLSQDM